MIIDATNAQIINTKEVYFHDDCLEKLEFNRTEKILHLLVSKENDYNNYCSIDFLCVIGFEMTACDYWVQSPHIFDFEYVVNSDCTLIPKLFAKKNNCDSSACSLKDQKNYIETVITFTSGDELIIACESIIIR